eukprot:98760_1
MPVDDIKNDLEIRPCENLAEIMHNFMHEISSNNNNNNRSYDTFAPVITHLNPLSTLHRTLFCKADRDMIQMYGYNIIERIKSTSNIEQIICTCFIMEYAYKYIIKKPHKPNQKTNNLRQQILNELNKVKDEIQIQSLDELSLMILTYFVSNNMN